MRHWSSQIQRVVGLQKMESAKKRAIHSLGNCEATWHRVATLAGSRVGDLFSRNLSFLRILDCYSCEHDTKLSHFR